MILIWKKPKGRERVITSADRAGRAKAYRPSDKHE